MLITVGLASPVFVPGKARIGARSDVASERETRGPAADFCGCMQSQPGGSLGQCSAMSWSALIAISTTAMR